MREQIDNLRKETETTLRILYALKQFRFFVTQQKDVDKLNKNPHFWLIYESSLRTNLFLGIRRLYEGKSDSFNFHTFIFHCIKNIGEFSKESLQARKMAASENAAEWIEEYIAHAYEPTEDDLKKLARGVRANSKKMKGIYTEAASKIYAHAVHMDHATIATMTDKLSFEEIEAALTSIWHVYEQVWQMYENGKEPVFEIGSYPHEQEVIDSVINQLG